MTLIISVASKHGAWQLSDRRYGLPMSPSYPATKTCGLETINSRGMVSYSGFGAVYRTPREAFELSEWLVRTLRGRKIAHDDAVRVLLNAAKKRRLATRANPRARAHTFHWAGFLEGVPTIDVLSTGLAAKKMDLRTRNISNSDGMPGEYSWERIEARGSGVVISTAGSGSEHLSMDELSRIHKLTNGARISRDHKRRVDAYLSSLNRLASQRDRNNSVSPECIVTFRGAEGSGWHRAFDRYGKSYGAGPLPSIVVGIPVRQLVDAILPIVGPHLHELLEAAEAGRDAAELDAEALAKAAAAVDDAPDDWI